MKWSNPVGYIRGSDTRRVSLGEAQREASEERRRFSGKLATCGLCGYCSYKGTMEVVPEPDPEMGGLHGARLSRCRDYRSCQGRRRLQEKP